MITKMQALGDKMLSALLPEQKAAACASASGNCDFRYVGCAGGQCYYYYQWGDYCYVYSSNSCPGNRLIQKRRGCC